MRVWIWRNKGDKGFYLSRQEPRRLTEDNFALKLSAGDWAGTEGDRGVVVSIMPDDLLPLLPSEGEAKNMLFHEELWGKAQEFSSYDKTHWITLQSMLE